MRLRPANGSHWDLYALVSLLVTLVLLMGGRAFFAQRRGRLVRVWEQAAHALGLRFEQLGERRWSIHGAIDGVPVRAQFRRELQPTPAPRAETAMFYAGVSGRIPANLTLRADSAMRRLIEGQDQQLGDPSFDALVELHSLDAFVCAALDRRAREGLRTLIEKGGAVHEGMIVQEELWSDYHDSVWLVEKIRFLAELARLLSVTGDELCGRLEQNAVSDPSPAVRLQNLRFLLDAQTKAPPDRVKATARTLLGDSSADVRVLAAKQLGSEGIRTLMAVACELRVQTPLRVEALHGLRSAPASDLVSLLASLLGSGPPEVVRAALSLVSARRLSALTEAVVDCTRSDHEAVRIAAADALVNLASMRREETLIRLLADPSSEVRGVSASALGVVGGPAAIEALSAVANAFSGSELRDAARAAIERIQLRLADPDAGHVSLSEINDLAGAIAIAEQQAVETGQIALAAEDTGAFGERQRFSWLEDVAPPKPGTS